MSTTVVNKRSGQPYDVYIGRGSVWGNPYPMENRSDTERARVIAAFEAHLLAQPNLLARLGELRGKRLACFCAPKACHGDVLARYADAAMLPSKPAPSPKSETFHIALTGHRPGKLAGYDLGNPFYGNLRRHLMSTIEVALKEHHHLTLHSGMALGADTVWSEAVVNVRAMNPDRITFVAEVPVMTQSDRWVATTDKQRWARHIKIADTVNVYAERYTPRCLWDRNEGMIDAADRLIAIWDGHPGGGTAGAVTYARRKGVPVQVLSPDAFRG